MRTNTAIAVALIAAVAGCKSADVCKGVSGTCLDLHVSGEGISAVDQLQVALSGVIDAGPKVTPSAPLRQALPIDLALSVEPTSSGTLVLAVEGLVGGVKIADGSGTVALVSGLHATVPVVLHAATTPDDLAVADEGSFVDMAKPLGGPGHGCTLGSECASGFCADGVCCNSACTDACSACNLSSNAGTCSPVAPGSTPAAGHADCGPDTHASCQRDGTCDGAGHCRLWDSTTICKAPSCNTGSQQATGASHCDGNGTCVTPSTTIPCAPYVCKSDGTGCYPSCTDNTQCQSPNVCNTTTGSCGPKVNGTMCTGNAECQSGHCIDGVCCATVCASCYACNLNGVGTCAVVGAGVTDPRAACTVSAPSSCGTNGKCDGSGGCQKYGTTTSCGSSSCSGTTVRNQNCDGAGTCVTVNGTDCHPNACRSGACVTECDTPPVPPSTMCGADNTACAPGCTCTVDVINGDCFGVCSGC